MQTEYEFEVGDTVYKTGGSYQATGTIKARFLADDGTTRYVFRFKTPAGLLHIFSGKQLSSTKFELTNPQLPEPIMYNQEYRAQFIAPTEIPGKDEFWKVTMDSDK